MSECPHPILIYSTLLYPTYAAADFVYRDSLHCSDATTFGLLLAPCAVLLGLMIFICCFNDSSGEKGTKGE